MTIAGHAMGTPELGLLDALRVLAEDPYPPGCTGTWWALLRRPVVIPMQTTSTGRDELPNHLQAGALHQLARDSVPNTLVRSRMVEVFLVVLHYAVQVPLAHDQDVVQAFSLHTTQKRVLIESAHPVGIYAHRQSEK